MEVAPTLHPFSDRLSPIFVRDLRRGLRANYFVWAFCLFQVAALIATIVEVALAEVLDSSGVFLFSAGAQSLMLGLGFGLLLPLSQFSALHSEIGKGRNIELLLTSSLTRWQIVSGKFLVASTLSALLLISLLPYLLLRYFLGTVELTETLGMVATAFLDNMAMNAIVIGASGFLSVTGRIATILYFLVLHNLLAAGNLHTFGSRTGMVSPALSILCIAIGGIVIALLALQLGRARLKLYEDPLDPPASAGLFAIALAVPVANAIAAALGGVMASLFLLLALVVIVLRFDRGPGRIFASRGLQP